MKISGEIRQLSKKSCFGGGLSPELSALALKIERAGAPWQGLKVQFQIDKNVYSSSDLLLLSCLISNPTEKERSVFFEKEERVRVVATKGRGYARSRPVSPENIQLVSAISAVPRDGLHEIKISPGETVELRYRWNLTYRKQGGDEILHITPGHVTLSAGLSDIALRTHQDLEFDLTEPDSPFIGEIISDTDGAKRESNSYIFKLEVTNRSNSSQEIAFPHAEVLDVQLIQDQPRLHWQPLMYATPAMGAEKTHRVLIRAGETHIFERRVSKKEIGLFPSLLSPGYTEDVYFQATVMLVNSTVTMIRKDAVRIAPNTEQPRPSILARIGNYPKIQGYFEVRGMNWRCLGFNCESPADSKNTTVEICRELQGKVGKIKTFKRNGIALEESELQICNQK